MGRRIETGEDTTGSMSMTKVLLIIGLIEVAIIVATGLLICLLSK
jgi:hypothetical protein